MQIAEIIPLLPISNPCSNLVSDPGKIKKFGSFKFSYKFEVESLHPIIFLGKVLTSLVTASTENLYPLRCSKLYIHKHILLDLLFRLMNYILFLEKISSLIYGSLFL